jgi:hypothetical protein
MVDEQAQERIELVNETLGAEAPYKLALVDPKDLVPAEKNARYMTSEQFSKLVANVARDGALSSLPLCWLSRNRYHVLSGNHRVQAATEAGLPSILILYTDRKLSKSERLSMQLSHNSIVGQDDPTLLRDLWEEIGDLDAKLYSGLDDKMMEALDSVTLPPLSSATLEYRQLTFLFLPPEAERLEEVLKKALEIVSARDVRVARHAEWDRLLDALSTVSDAHDIRNSTTTLMLLLDVFERHQTDLAEGWEGDDGEPKHKGWVPLSTIFGGDRVPAGAAMTIQRAVKKMQERGDITEKSLWGFIEYAAADYLSEPEGEA